MIKYIGKNMIKPLLLFCFFFCSVFGLFAQTQVQKSYLLDFARDKSAEWQAKHTDAVRIANEKGFPVSVVFSDSAFAELQEIRNGMPLYYITNNINSAYTVSNDKVWPGGSTGYNLTGSGVTLGEWDGGRVRLSHQEFSGRASQIDGAATNHFHATHVAGTMIAAGIDASAKGMSYQASLRAFDWNSDVSEMTTEAAGGLKASNHSYGYLTGWRSNYFGDGLWTWFGDVSISTTEDSRFGYYDVSARDWDDIAYNAPNYLIFKSAGNDRGEGPSGAVNSWYWDGSSWVTAVVTRDKDGGTAGYDCIEGSGNSKNILTIGAVNDIPGGYTQASDVVMSSFSGWGPCDDGRIKPDIVTNGILLYSALETSDNAYGSMSGTSMASPSATGSFGLLLHHLALNCGGGTRNAATWKGLIIHTADEAGSNNGPDYAFGWGLMNTKKAAQLMSQNAVHTNPFEIQELVLDNGETEDIKVYTDGLSPVRATICWTDKKGTPVTPALDPPDKMLVNDLDLRIIRGVTTYYPWTLDKSNPGNAARNDQDNSVDNVEQVYISSITEGELTIRITHKGTLSSPAYQNFSIVLSGVTQLIPPTLTSPSNNSFGITVSPTLQWQSVTRATQYRIQYSTDVNFGSYTESTSAAASQSVSGLSNNTKYYWRVRAENASTTGPWSAKWNFTTVLSTPSLTNPANAVYSIPVAGTVTWGAVTGAESYDLQVATDAGFTSLVVNQAGIAATSYDYTGLSNNQLFYWQVRAKNTAGNSSAWATARTFTTNLATPSLSSPANSSYSIDLNGSVSWNNTSGATLYDLQVATDAAFTNIVNSQSNMALTTTTLSGLSNNTLYYWHIMAKNATGNTSLWSVARTFTTKLAAPGLTSPANNALSVPVNGSVNWGAVTGANTYDIQIASDASFTNIIASQSGYASTGYNYSGLANNTQYFWRVSAHSATGNTSNVSAVYSFTTMLTAPVPVSPADNSKAQPISITMNWNPSSGANTYNAQLSANPDMSSPLMNTYGLAVTTTSYSPLINNTVYYWRIQAQNASGNTSEWTTPFRFKTKLEAPSLTAPADNANAVPVTGNVVWASVTGASSYAMEISKDAGFTNIIINKSGLPSTNTTYEGLENNTKYYWRVSASNIDGQGDWSASRQFTTELGQPVLVSPADGDENQSVTGTLTWQQVSGALDYDLQISEDAAFGTTKVNVPAITLLTYNFSGLDFNKTYYWRTRASNSEGKGPWSAVWSFQTKLEPPVLIAPADNSKSIKIPVNFEWSSVAGAESYNLQISRMQDFSVLFNNTNNITGTSINLNNLNFSPYTVYYWRVQAVTTKGNGKWAAPWMFTTFLGAPLPTSPANEATDIPVTTKCEWQQAPGADSYDFQLSVDPAFSDLILDKTGITDLYYDVYNLDYYKVYYWRARSKNATETSDWSDEWNFKTLLPKPILLTPPDNSTSMELAGKLTWKDLGLGVKYNVQISDVQSFSSVLKEETVNITSYDYTGLEQNKDYYWRIYAVFPGNVKTTWSDTWKFRTKLGIAKPVLSDPANNSYGIALSGIIKWLPVIDAEEYQIQISNSSDFSSTVADVNGLKTAQYSYVGYSYGTFYYWRVKASNKDFTSEWSDTWKFRTMHGSPVAIAGTNPGTDSASVNASAINGRIAWRKQAGAVSYNLQVSETNDFSTSIINQKAINDTFYIYTNLTNYKQYYWRVQGVFNEETGIFSNSEWSAVMPFKTKLSAPANYISPIHLAADISPVSGIISWEAVAGADFYKLQVAKDGIFTDFAVDEANLPQNQYSYKDLLELTDYYWHVRAGNTDGVSNWSAPWQFRTKLYTSVNDIAIFHGSLTIMPNPAGSEAFISFSLDIDADINITAYDLLGNKIAEIADGRFIRDNYLFRWDLISGNIPAGTYIIKLSVNGEVKAGKISVIK